ncbi:MAG: helix-turn-helix transcriptional regulator [Muribaculaceae bacterium]|nr:helix-turn-helix transcriptional regulator [Muribaculaceae bacterium]
MIKNKLSIVMGIRRMNMAELARIAGLSHVTVFKIYHNKTKTIELETIDKLCKALNCRIQDIFEQVEDKD